MTHVRFAIDLLYELSHDIKNLLDQGVNEQEVYNLINKRIQRDFKDIPKTVRIEWDSKNYRRIREQ